MHLNQDPEQTSLRIRRRTRKGSEARRAELLGCAIKAFAERGLRRAVHADVAALTDVSIPTVFRYFPTREDLVNAVLEAVADFWYGGVIARLPQDPFQNPREALYAIIVSLCDAFAANPEFSTLWLEWSSSINEEYWFQYIEFIDKDVEAYRVLIESGKDRGFVSREIDSDSASRLIVGQSQTVAAMIRSGIPKDRRNTFIRFYIDAALGLLPMNSKAKR